MSSISFKFYGFFVCLAFSPPPGDVPLQVTWLVHPVPSRASHGWEVRTGLDCAKGFLGELHQLRMLHGSY